MNQIHKPYDQPSSSVNSRSQSGWILCRSKTFPDRYYHFNVLTGEAAWYLSENDRTKFKKRDDLVTQEPSSPPPPESPNTSHSTRMNVKPIFTPRGNVCFENRYRDPSTSFGVATFPQYFPYHESYGIPSIQYSSNFWGIPNHQMYFAPSVPFSTPVLSSTPMPSPSIHQNTETLIKKSSDKVTQTPLGGSPDCVEITPLPLSERSGHTYKEISERSGHTNKEISERSSHTNKEISERSGHTIKEISERSGHINKEISERSDHTNKEISERSGHTNKEISERSGHTNKAISERSGHTNKETSERSGHTNKEISERSGHTNEKLSQTPLGGSPDCVEITPLPLSERSGHTNKKISERSGNKNEKLSDNQHSFVPIRKNIKITESDKSQQIIPIVTKNRTPTKSESIQTENGVANCKCMQQHKKITMSEKPDIVFKSTISTVQECKSNEDVKLLKPIPESVIATGKCNKNQSKTASGKNYNVNEKLTKTVQIVNQSPEEETTEKNITEGLKNNEKSLDKYDLRHMLIAKRRKPVDSEKASPYPEVGVNIKELAEPLPMPAPKRVTFDFAKPQSLEGVGSGSVQTSGRSFEAELPPIQDVFNPQELYTTKKLRDLSKRFLSKTETWFIVVDLQVLIQELELLQGLVESDERCRIQIPAKVQSLLYSLCKGDCRTRLEVMSARHTARHVASNTGTFIVEGQSGDRLFVHNGIVQCCKKVLRSGHHAILVSNNTQLRLQANNIHCFTVQELKNMVTQTQKATFDLTSIKTSIQNESTQNPPPEITIKPTYTDNEILCSATEVNFENTSKSMTEEKQTQKEKIQTKTDAQNSSIIFNRPYELTKTLLKKTQNEKAFVKNVTKTAKDILEEELEEFATKHKELEENLSWRKEEGMVSFVQIMEDVLTDILQTKTSPHLKELPPPWALNEAIECLKMCYQHDEKIKSVCEMFSDTLTADIKSCDFIRLAGCGSLLLESLKNHEVVNEAVTSLGALLVQLNSPVQEPGVAVVTRVVDKNDTHTEERYKSFVKHKSEVIEYLKRHYPAWQTYEYTTEYSRSEVQIQDTEQIVKTEGTNPKDVKVVRTFGRHLKNFRIHSTRNMTVETNPNIEATDKAPTHEYDKVPSNKYDKAPSNKNDKAPLNKYDKAPSNKNDKAPLNKYDKAPSNKNEKAPSIKYDKAPSIKYDRAPSNKYDKAPLNEYYEYEEPLNVYDTGNTFKTNNNDAEPNRNIVRKVGVIKEYEDKLKRNLDIDLQDISNVSLNDINDDMLLKEYEEKLKLNLDIDLQDISNVSLNDINDDMLLKDLELSEVTTNDEGNIVNTIIQTIDNTKDNDKIKSDNQKSYVKEEKACVKKEKAYVKKEKAHVKKEKAHVKEQKAHVKKEKAHLKEENGIDSGVENTNECLLADSVVTMFLNKLTETFMGIYNFIQSTKSEIIQDGRLKENRKYVLYSEVIRAQTDVAEIMDTLRSIRDREKSENTREALRRNIKLHSNDTRLKTYRQVVTKFLEQFEILCQALQVVKEILNRRMNGHRTRFTNP